MVVTGLLVMFLVCASLLGATKLLWYDEFLTHYPAKMSLPDLFAFYHNALDTQTPTQALLNKRDEYLRRLPLGGTNPFDFGFCACVSLYLPVCRAQTSAHLCRRGDDVSRRHDCDLLRYRGASLLAPVGLHRTRDGLLVVPPKKTGIGVGSRPRFQPRGLHLLPLLCAGALGSPGDCRIRPLARARQDGFCIMVGLSRGNVLDPQFPFRTFVL